MWRGNNRPSSCGRQRVQKMGGKPGGKPARGTRSSTKQMTRLADFKLQRPLGRTTSASRKCRDMCRARSVCKEWDCVSKGRELLVGKFLIEFFTPLTLVDQHRVFSRMTTKVWAAAKSEAISKVRKLRVRAKGAEDLTRMRRKWKRPSGSVGPMVSR